MGYRLSDDAPDRPFEVAAPLYTTVMIEINGLVIFQVIFLYWGVISLRTARKNSKRAGKMSADKYFRLHLFK